MNDTASDILNPDICQQQAANPACSVWVCASAGSGKTKVLSDRVLNLLLLPCNPSQILCLTFTNAAAAQMRNKIAKRLGDWVGMDEAKLKQEIYKLQGKAASSDQLALARQLFAKTLDATGGMKIMTIHAFCGRLLKMFPIEAGVIPAFKGIDDTDAKLLLGQVIEEAVKSPALRPDVELISLYIEQNDFAKALLDAGKDRAKFAKAIAKYGSVEGITANIYARFGIQQNETAQTVLDEILKVPTKPLKDILPVLERGGKIANDSKDAIADFLSLTDKNDLLKALPSYIKAFLTDNGTMRTRIVTDKNADKLQAFVQEADRLAFLEEKRKKIIFLQGCTAFLRIVFATLEQYQKAKDLRGWLDYNDLILRTKNLLEDNGAAWVLYKLDGGVSHILVDEAQDTNPEQWDIINALSSEFFAGDTARQDNRTIFAVGDGKQSIFSFQGANPEKFTLNRQRFKQAAEAIGQTFKTVPLQTSFRSTKAVLSVVEQVLSYDEAAKGVINDKSEATHISYRSKAAGRVEIWPLTPFEAKEETDLSHSPNGTDNAKSPQDKLAGKIADKIKEMLATGEILESENRPIRPSDIMILLRQRKAFFEKLVRALKERQVPVTGVDRMHITEQIAVMDLLALGNFLCLPDDDLNLACVLKSPLCNLTEEELFTLCVGRGSQSLWTSLCNKAEEEGQAASSFAKVTDYLKELLGKTDWLMPSALYGYILGAKGGRNAILKRLGLDADDALTEFMNLVLDYEKDNVPSLQNFLIWITKRDIEIKRDLEQGDIDAVRIATVHGSKGLEAPVIFLPDTIGTPAFKDKLFWLDDDTVPLWLPETKLLTEPLSSQKEQSKEKTADEFRRLLYVALTRARDRLYIAGWQPKKVSKLNWYDLITSAIDTANAEIKQDENGEVLVFSCPQTGDFEQSKSNVLTNQNLTSLPDWVFTPASPEPIPPKPLSPSHFSETEDNNAQLFPVDAARTAAMQKGNCIHKLLEILPQITDKDEQEKAAALYIAATLPDLSDTDKALLVKQVSDIINNARFKDFFGKDSQGEVAITGMVEGKVFSGQIDRLCVLPDEVIVIDYKTNYNPPKDKKDVPLPYIKQLGIYKSLLEQLFKDKKVRTFLLWTQTSDFMEI